MSASKVFWVAVVMVALSVYAARADGPPSIKQDCGICHARGFDSEDIKLLEPLSGLCIKCHPDRVEADHVVDVRPKMDVGGLPLDKDGRMTCVTCHTPHGRTGISTMLRDWPVKICNRCHDK